MNRIRQKQASGERFSGLILQQLRDDLVIRLIAAAGFDSIIIDMEHGTFSFEEAAHIAHLCRLLNIAPIVRPIDHSYANIARALDAGAAGVMLPRIRSAEEVREAIQHAKYPPLGGRGMSGQRGQAEYLPVKDRNEFAQDANRDTLVIVQIETVEAVEAVDEIMQVSGVDIVLVGPTDLSMSLGGIEYNDPVLIGSIQRVVETGRRTGMTVGMAVSDIEKLRHWRGEGMSYLVFGTEVSILTSGLLSAGRAVVDLVK